jgi:uncharacterized protein YndB with AHSA1/START domain
MDEVSTEIAAAPEAVYDLVVDVTQMGRWSPETYRCEWLDGATAPLVGGRFKGWNKDKWGPIPVRWSTTCTVERADPGRAFAFKVRDSGARWAYRFEPTDTGCRVTETRELGDKPLIAKVFNVVMGPGKRDDTVIAGMTKTLERLKAAAESAEAPA